MVMVSLLVGCDSSGHGAGMIGGLGRAGYERNERREMWHDESQPTSNDTITIVWFGHFVCVAQYLPNAVNSGVTMCVPTGAMLGLYPCCPYH